jgi:cell division protein FtsA
MRGQGDLVAAVDIGTSKVCAVVGRQTPNGLAVEGFGIVPCRALRDPETILVRDLSQSLKEAFDEAELTGQCHIGAVHFTFSGGHVEGTNVEAELRDIQGTVSRADVDRVLRLARDCRLPSGAKVLHNLVQEYGVDKTVDVRDPIGMSGRRLDVRAHRITANEAWLKAIVRSIGETGRRAVGAVAMPVAVGDAVLTTDEKREGTVVVDYGATSTHLSIWLNGHIVHTRTIDEGAEMATADIGKMLRVDSDTARWVKEHSGCADPDAIDLSEEIVVPNARGGRLTRHRRRLLAQLIAPRAEELLDIVREEVHQSGYADMIPRGYVLTGGGASMRRLDDVARRFLGAPVRVGVPVDVAGISDVVRGPGFAAATGLLRIAVDRASSSALEFRVDRERPLQAFRRWVRELIEQYA